PARGGKGAAPIIQDDDLEDDEDDLYQPRPRAARRKIPFFSWFNETSDPEEHSSSDKDDWQMDDDHLVQPAGSSRSRVPQWDDDDEEGSAEWQAYNAGKGSPAVVPEVFDPAGEIELPPAIDSSRGLIDNTAFQGEDLEPHLVDGEEIDDAFTSISSPSSPPVSPAIETGELAEGSAAANPVPRVPAVKPYQL
ncbi:hypothetical protein K0U00_46060, partial [Paenibacillus sepulcri]|nr:hypothetical protein [Paenibacillus sepulcri]